MLLHSYFPGVIIRERKHRMVNLTGRCTITANESTQWRNITIFTTILNGILRTTKWTPQQNESYTYSYKNTYRKPSALSHRIADGTDNNRSKHELCFMAEAAP